jgi:hypothetical protein
MVMEMYIGIILELAIIAGAIFAVGFFAGLGVWAIYSFFF